MLYAIWPVQVCHCATLNSPPLLQQLPVIQNDSRLLPVAQVQESWLGMGGASPSRPFAEHMDRDKEAQEDDAMPDWDDEDLLAMQAEPLVSHWLLKGPCSASSLSHEPC